jgi:hypothetical protein
MFRFRILTCGVTFFVEDLFQAGDASRKLLVLHSLGTLVQNTYGGTQPVGIGGLGIDEHLEDGGSRSAASMLQPRYSLRVRIAAGRSILLFERGRFRDSPGRSGGHSD